MDGRFGTSQRRLGLVLAVVVALGAASIGWAAIPDANDVFHACVNENSGVLRIIDTELGDTCNPNESAISWNQAGTQGLPGPTLFANVNADGSLVSGTATTASRVSTGHYFVTFEQDVGDCAAVVSPGFTASSEGRAEADLVIVSTGHGPSGADPNDVEVLFTPVVDATEGNTAFHLVLAC